MIPSPSQQDSTRTQQEAGPTAVGRSWWHCSGCDGWAATDERREQQPGCADGHAWEPIRPAGLIPQARAAEA